MIHLIDNYYAEPYPYGYVLLEDRGRFDKKGNPVYDSIGYCGDFKETLLLLKKKIIAKKLKKGMHTIETAIQAINETDNELKKLLEETIHE